jgi:hypothetical protein
MSVGEHQPSVLVSAVRPDRHRLICKCHGDSPAKSRCLSLPIASGYAVPTLISRQMTLASYNFIRNNF